MVGAAHALDERSLAGKMCRVGGGEAVDTGDVDGQEIGVGAACDPAGAPQDGVAFRAAGQRNDDAFASLPGGGDVVVGAVTGELVIDLVGDPQQGEFAQRGEVADPEVVPQRGVDAFRRIDVAVGQRN